MITEEMKSTLLDIEINNPEGIQNLKALLKNYSDIIGKDQSTLSEEEEQYAYFLDCYSGDDQYTDLYTHYENQYPEYNHQLKHYGK